MKPCPYCFKEIQEEAIKCKHCGKFISDKSDMVNPSEKKKPSASHVRKLIYIILLFVSIFGARKIFMSTVSDKKTVKDVMSSPATETIGNSQSGEVWQTYTIGNLVIGSFVPLSEEKTDILKAAASKIRKIKTFSYKSNNISVLASEAVHNCSSAIYAGELEVLYDEAMYNISTSSGVTGFESAKDVTTISGMFGYNFEGGYWYMKQRYNIKGFIVADDVNFWIVQVHFPPNDINLFTAQLIVESAQFLKNLPQRENGMPRLDRATQ